MNARILIIALFCFNQLYSQNDKYPNIKEDLVGSENYYHDWGLDVVAYGYTGGVYQGHYVKENSIYASVTAGFGFYNNFKFNEVEGEKSGWAIPASVEVGYSLELFIRKNKDRFVGNTSYVSNDHGVTSQRIEYYSINQPEHVFLIPVAGINHSPGTFKLQTKSANSDLEDGVLYNQSVLVLSAGVKLLRIINNKVSIRDQDSKKEITGTSFKYSDFYVGLNFPLRSSYETTPSYSDINAAGGPTLEAFLGWPTRYSNASGYFKFGYKSIPYVRKGMLRPIDGDTEVNTGGFGQLYLAFRYYI